MQLPPVYGLYNSITGTIPYFFFGTSPHLIVGPTAVMSLIVRSGIPRETSQGTMVEEASAEWIGFTTTMSFLTGISQFIMGIFGLGVFVQLVSDPVMHGFVTASALLMIFSQLSSLLGLPKCNASDLLGDGHDFDDCYLPEYIASIAKHGQEIHILTTFLSVSSIILLLSFKYLSGKYQRLSKLGPIILSVSTLCLFYYFAHNYGTKTDEKGRVFDKKWDVRLVGPIPKGLPHPSSPFSSVPTFGDVMKVFTTSLVLAILGFMESMAIASNISRQTKIGKLSPSRELLALGVSNLLGSVLKGYPITGSFSRTAVNAESGAKSQVSALVSALIVGLVLVLLSDVIQYMPRFALAAIVLVSVINLVKPEEGMFLYRTNGVDFFSYFFVVLITMFLGFERGLACGVLVSWIGTMMHRHPPKLELLRKTGDSTFQDVPSSNSIVCDVVILKLESSLLFSNLVTVENAFNQAYLMFKPKCMILDMHKCAAIDTSGVKLLAQLGEFASNSLEVKAIYITGLYGDARRVIERAKLADDNLLWNLSPIVAGLGDGVSPNLLAFESIQEALAFASANFNSKNGDIPSDTLSQEALELVENARISAWRQGGNISDIDPGWRVPTFMREIPFEIISKSSPL